MKPAFFRKCVHRKGEIEPPLVFLHTAPVPIFNSVIGEFGALHFSRGTEGFMESRFGGGHADPEVDGIPSVDFSDKRRGCIGILCLNSGVHEKLIPFTKYDSLKYR